MSAPCAVFASCIETPPDTLIKDILGGGTLPEATSILENISAYPWHVDTKYYTADIHLCATKERTIGDEQFANSVHAIILQFDSRDSNSFNLVQSWLPYIDQIEAPVLLLVGERCTNDDAVPRSTVLKWCLEHSFELVELQPIDGTDSEDEDDFPETTGVKRIIQALHAHTWPNLELKENHAIQSPYIRQLMQEQAKEKAKDNKSENNSSTSDCKNTPKTNCSQNTECSENTDCLQSANDLNQQTTNGSPGENHSNGATGVMSQSSSKETKNKQEKSRIDRIDGLLPNEDMATFAALANEDPSEGDESFEQLFEKMKIMKDHADTLPLDQRKAYAEKVALSFWRAIGGDEDEIEGLSDSD
ncbi:unnamed protein product [Owenia fusiformis]|uniref:Alpha-and gamma-adaptin-binding protein p34 n=1 Tax=Owenia fusiformis TaxID=6347 RepID=A0A8S4PR36_OWEFU|nr:unnamed protein product [Owenia fusiformis]